MPDVSAKGYEKTYSIKPTHLTYAKTSILFSLAAMDGDEAQAAAQIQLVYRARLARFSVDRRRRSLVRREATARWEREQAVIKIQVRRNLFDVLQLIQRCELGTPDEANNAYRVCSRMFADRSAPI